MRKLLLIMLLGLLLTGCAGQPAAAPEPTPAETQAPAQTEAPAEAEAALTEPSDAMPTLSFADAAAKVRADSDAFYLFATNVGKGDALILRAGDAVCLIDTGKAWARGRVDNALALMGSSFKSGDSYHLDAVFLTHTDDDHTGGLRWMTDHDGWIPGRRIEALYASAMYTGVKKDKHPAVKAMGAAQWLKRGDEVPLGDSGAVLKVLAPASLYEDEDDNSLVMMLESPQGKILLTGDMESYEEAELLAFGDDLKCDVLKVANHGDSDATGAAFANACAARIAVISTSSEEKPGTPDPAVVARLEAAGSAVAVTEDSGLGVLVTLKDGVAEAAYVDYGAPPVSGVSIAQVDASDDRITLESESDAPVNLGYCYLYSDRGDELFVFPDGVTVEPGVSLTVGTNSTDGDFDRLWDDKKVINRKKSDAIYLFDPWGRLIDWMGNGL